MHLTRRQVLFTAAIASSAAPPSFSAPDPGQRSPVVLFTKILDQMSSPELVRTVKEIGFDGLDVTVRRNGHVDPQQVEQRLPEVVRLAKGAGLVVPMISTELTSATDPSARPILATAHSVGVRCFKTGYRDYDQKPIPPQIPAIHREYLGLAALAKNQQMTMGIHNHNGRRWGQAVWDTKEFLERLPDDPCGFYYDPAHATVEGGSGGWQVTLDFALSRLRMIAVKDFLWEKQGEKWTVVWVPLGQGMVHWPEILRALLKSGFDGPMSLDLEYKSADPVGAIRRDFATLQALLADARKA